MGDFMKPLGLFLLAFVSNVAVSQASFTVRSGGDAVVCRNAPGAVFKGFQSLDYLVTYDDAGPKLVPVRSWPDSAQRLLRIFKAKLPELAPSFEAYAKNYLNRDPSRTHLWEPAAFGLIDLKDEDLVALLPENCRTSHGSAQIVQAVIRQPSGMTGRPPSSPVFTYVPKVLEELERTNPLQLSFLVVHEWLWDFSANADRNRRVNRFLHSELMEKLPRAELLKQLRGLGFVAPGDANAVLYEESCLPDPRGIAPMFSKGPGGGTRLVPNFEIVGRRMMCGALYGSYCQPAAAGIGGLLERSLTSHRGFSMGEGGYLRVLSILPGEGSRTHLNCKVDLQTAKIACDELIDRYGNPATSGRDPLHFSGTMNRTCIRLKADTTTREPIRKDFWTEESFVFYRRFDNQ